MGLGSGEMSEAAGRSANAVVRFVLGCLLLLPAGCQFPALRSADQGPVLPESYRGRTSGENSADVGIEEFFGDPVLTELIRQGLASNQELKIRNQEIQIAWNEILARRGAYLPFVSLGARGGFERTSRFTPLGAAEDLPHPKGEHFPDPLPNVLLSADLFWRIDIWRELRNARDAAIQRYVAAVEDRNYFVTRLVAEIAESYYELAALDKRLEYVNKTIEVQQQSLEVAQAQKAAARGTELGVQRFLAEVRKNESQRQIIQQRIIEVENRINLLVGRYPQPVERTGWDFINLDARALHVGLPAQLLQNRRDIRAAERELAASGLDIQVARARFFPTLDITAGIGFEAFNPRYLFDPGAFIANAAGQLVAPLINRKALQADYMTANARQLQAVYDYQRTVLTAFIEVVNALTKVENFRRSVEIKQQQVAALDTSIEVARELFQRPIPEEFARVEYVDVLLATRDLLEAQIDLIETKQQQLAAIVNVYQALGGGYLMSTGGPHSFDLYCPPLELAPQSVDLPPLAPSELSDQSGKATLTPPANEQPPPAAQGTEPNDRGAAATDQGPAGAQPATPPAGNEVLPLFAPVEDEFRAALHDPPDGSVVPLF